MAKQDKPEKKSFVFYHDWIEAAKDLSNEQLGELLRAIADRDRFCADYGGDDWVVKMCCNFIFPIIDTNKAKYQDISAKRAEAGRKGGKGGKSKQAEANEANASNSNHLIANESDNDI